MADASPRRTARTAGLFELLEALTSGFGQVIVPGMLVVAGDAASTAANILSHRPLFELSIVAALIGVACHIVWTLLFYELFKPVNRGLTLAAVFFSLVAMATQAFSIVFQLAPLVVLDAGHASSAFTGDQTQALALMLFRIGARAFDIYLVIFGFWCVLIGYLIIRSTFIPRAIGVLEVLAGLCWLTFLWTPLAHSLSPYNQALAGFGEMSLTLWLLVMGVNVDRWKETAARDSRVGPLIGE
jgi:hypothetical protein